MLPDRLELLPQNAHVWYASLAENDENVAFFHEVLDESERTRAARFHFERDRRRFILARGWLRHLLARYTETNPATIQFTQNAWGKPALVNNSRAIHFNLSHSGDCAAYLFSRSFEVGIDIEQIDNTRSIDKLAARFFHPTESEFILAQPIDQRPNLFFRCWTQKEAILKYIGSGLTISPRQFAVDPNPVTSMRILNSGGLFDPAHVTILELQPGTEILGSAVFGGTQIPNRVEQRQLPPRL